MKTATTIMEEVFKGFLFGILPLLLFILITSRSPLIGGMRSFVVLTGSMDPTIPVGTIVFTHPLQLYRLNDVISFKKGDRTITHRVVDVQIEGRQLFYRTRGDANNATDSDTVPQNDIVGKVFFGIPYLGQLVFFIKTVPGYLALILMPAVFYIIFELIQINHELKKEELKKITHKMGTV